MCLSSMPRWWMNIGTSSSPDLVSTPSVRRLTKNTQLRSDHLSGAHGFPDGSIVSSMWFYFDGVKAFGSIDGVTVHYLPMMSSDAVAKVLGGPGTIVEGFCNSEACLAAWLLTILKDAL